MSFPKSSRALIVCISLALFAGLNTSVYAEDENTEAKGKSGMMEKIAQKNLGRDIAFRFRPYMLGMTGIRLENFKIAENEQYLKDHPYLSPWALSAESVDVRYNPFAILLGRISLKKIEVINPKVQFAVDDRAKTNFDDLAEQQKKNRFSNWIRAHHVQVRNMNVDIYSEIMFAQPIVYEVHDIDVDIRNVIKKKVATVDIAAKTPGALKQNVAITGTIGPIVSIARMEESPMDISYIVADAPLEFELAKIPKEVMNDRRYRRTLALPESGLANMTLDLDGDVWSGMDVRGDIDLTDIVLASINKEVKGKSFDVGIDVGVNVSLDKQISKIEKLSINVNDAIISVEGQVKNIIDNPETNVRVRSANIDLADFNDIYPFISEIYKIKVIDGTNHLNLQTGGNLKKGLTLSGGMKLNNMQLAATDSPQKGKALDMSIELSKGISFGFSENKLKFEQIDINIAKSNIQLSGEVENATQIERKMKANIHSDALDVKAMHDFFPFYDKYLPSSLSYGGKLSFDAQAEGNLTAGEIKGKANLSELTFVLENFARKKNKSPFGIKYSGGYTAEGEFFASASYVMEKGELDNSEVYIDAIKHLLGGNNMSAEAKQYLAKIDRHNISFSKSKGKLLYKGDDTVEVAIDVLNLSNTVQKNVDLKLKGDMNVDNFDINFKGQITLPKTTSQQIVALNPAAKRYLSTDKSIMILPLTVSGSMTNPVMKPS